MNTRQPIQKFKSDTSAISFKNKLNSSDNKTVDTKHFQIFDIKAQLRTKTSILDLQRNYCELERSTILNILMIYLESPCLAG